MLKSLKIFIRHKGLLVFALITAAATILGSSLDRDGFWVGVLSGFLGTFIGIAVSVAVVEKLINEQNAQVWKSSRQVMLNGIVLQVNAAVRAYMELLPGYGKYHLLLENQYGISKERTQLIEQLYTDLSKTKDGLSRTELTLLYSQVSEIYSKIFSLNLSYMVTPGAESELVDCLSQADSNFQKWVRIMEENKAIEIDKAAMIEPALSALAALVSILRCFDRLLGSATIHPKEKK